MTDVQQVVIFLHYYGTGPGAKLARGVRAAVDLLGKPTAGLQKFCEKRAMDLELATHYLAGCSTKVRRSILIGWEVWIRTARAQPGMIKDEPLERPECDRAVVDVAST